jgi:hypothetical protein
MSDFSLEGGCDCKAVRYRMTRSPLIVHCCHCRWCQRETGSAFVINAVVEADSVVLLGEEPDAVVTPSESGKGQTISRSPKCRIAVYSNYAAAGDLTRFVRVGTLDTPDALTPDVHIYVTSKVPWVILPPDARTFDAFYSPKAVWSEDARARFAALRAKAAAARA